MDDKFNVRKGRKAETKQEIIERQIEELVKRQDLKPCGETGHPDGDNEAFCAV